MDFSQDKEEIKRLREELSEAGKQYYDNDVSVMTDFEYDRKLRRLEELENLYPEMGSADSPTQKVGGSASTIFEKVVHSVPMESLEDVFDVEELQRFGDRIEAECGKTVDYVVEPKIDGLSVSLEYINGVFTRGATRGDGLIGEDVTENLKTIRSIPRVIPNAPARLVVRGEVFMPKSVFLEINEERARLGQPLLSNPRNAAAGSLRQTDPNVTRDRKLDILIFNIQVSEGVRFRSHKGSLKYLEKRGFKTVPCYGHTGESRLMDFEIGALNSIDKARDIYDFCIDGAVIKVDDIRLRKKLGSTSKFPKWAVAYKYPPQEKAAQILDIVVQVGRTGVLTPKAVLTPVTLAGTVVSNATLHNKDVIDSNDIRVGDTVVVRKAGEIIPQIMSVVTSKRPEWAKPFVFPSECPVCGTRVIRDKGGVYIRCPNENCPAKLERKILHFVGRGCMNIRGVGPSLVADLVSSGLVESIDDLYRLSREDLTKLPHFGTGKASALLFQLDKSKGRDLRFLVNGLGIPNVGMKASKALADRYGDLSLIQAASQDEISEIECVGETIAKSVVEWFLNSENKRIVAALKDLGVNTKRRPENLDSPEQDDKLLGLHFVVTGTFRSVSRVELIKSLERHGAKVQSGVSKSTDYLICGENPGSKLKAAKERMVPVLVESDIRNIV